MKKFFISLLIFVLGTCWGYLAGIFAATAVPPSGRSGDARMLGYLFYATVSSFVLFFSSIFFQRKPYYWRLIIYLFLLVAAGSILTHLYTLYRYHGVIIL